MTWTRVDSAFEALEEIMKFYSTITFFLVQRSPYIPRVLFGILTNSSVFRNRFKTTFSLCRIIWCSDLQLNDKKVSASSYISIHFYNITFVFYQLPVFHTQFNLMVLLIFSIAKIETRLLDRLYSVWSVRMQWTENPLLKNIIVYIHLQWINICKDTHISNVRQDPTNSVWT